MNISTRRKILFGLFLVLVVATITMLVVFQLTKRQERLFYNYSGRALEQVAEAIVRQTESQVFKVVFDYTYWDDMVSFAQNPETAWGDDNLATLHASFGFDYVLVFNQNREVVYEYSNEDIEPLFIESITENFLDSLHLQRFCSFYEYVNQELGFFQGATIHPTDDVERNSQPRGYLIVGNLWIDDEWENAQRLSGAALSVFQPSEYITDPLPPDIIQAEYFFRGLNGEEVAVGVFKRKLQFHSLLRKNSWFLLGFSGFAAIFTLMMLGIFIDRWVSRPLALTARAIESEDISLLPEIKKASRDFDNIARLLESFLLQKDELVRAKDRAEESDRLKSAFLANMSHEIRTPLNGVLGFAELLKGENLSSEQRNHYTGIIQSSGNHLLDLVNDIVDISKIESGLVKPYPEVFDVGSLLDEVFQFFEQNPLLKKKTIGLSFKTHIEEEDGIINSDRIRLRQVLSNLIGNAIKFTQEGEIEFGVKKAGSDHVLFYVKDTGIGIDSRYHNTIFDRFTQVEGIPHYQGTGLGLAISKGLVELLGGRIWVESEPGKGAVFQFTIPVKA